MGSTSERRRRADELAHLSQQTSDKRMRNILLCLSREFSEEAAQILATDAPDRQLFHPVPWRDEA